ncbi:MAG: GNAT family N-acetyltransferase [Alsobacter sp.]
MTNDVRILDGAAARAALPELVGILVDCVEGGASVGFMQPYGQAEAQAWWDGVVGEVTAGATVLFGAAVDGRLVGTAQLGVDQKPNQSHRADVKKVLVHRDARGRGVGTALMRAIEAEAQRRGLILLVLDTATGSEAERLYQRGGWVRVGEIPNYARWPEGPLCGTTVYYKPLSR